MTDLYPSFKFLVTAKGALGARFFYICQVQEL